MLVTPWSRRRAAVLALHCVCVPTLCGVLVSGCTSSNSTPGVSGGSGNSATVGPAGTSSNTGGLPSAGAASGGAGSAQGGSTTGGAFGSAAGNAGTSAGGLASGGSAGSSAGGATGASGGATGASGGANLGGSSSGGVSSPGGAAQGGTAIGSAGTGSGGSAGASLGGAGTAGTGGSDSVFPPSVSKPRIMIVGDSISAGPGCYKKYLVQHLKENQITNYEFVGEYTDDCGGNVRHSAVSCSTAAQFTQPTFTMPNCSQGKTFPGMSTLVKTHNPDMILLQIGINDIWSGNTPVDSVLANYQKLIEQARAHNPHVVMVVAQIHKIITDNCQNMASTRNAEELVEAVPGWAQKLSTTASPVFAADLWTNSDAREADDCVHPNDAGAQRMGLNWFNAIKNLLKR